MRKDGGGERKRETSLSKKRDSLGRRLHLRRSLEDRKVDQEDAAAGEGPHAGKGGEGDGGGEEEELCVCVCVWVGRGEERGGVRFFFGSAAKVSRRHHHRGFPLAPSHSPGYFQHACQRRPATAHPGTRRTRSGRGRPGGLGCGACVRENESERATRSGQACVFFFVLLSQLTERPATTAPAAKVASCWQSSRYPACTVREKPMSSARKSVRARERECVRGARGGGMRESATPPYLPPYLPGELSWQTHLAAAGTNAGYVATIRPTRRRRPTGTGGENA